MSLLCFQLLEKPFLDFHFVTLITCGEVLLISAEFHCRALVCRHAIDMLEIHDRFLLTKMASRLDLLDGIGEFDEAGRSLKETRFEIGSKAVAKDRDLPFESNAAELFNHQSR